MLIEVGKQYWYPDHKKACRCTAINVLHRGKDVLYVVKSVLSSIDSLKTPMKVLNRAIERPVAGPEQYPLFNTEREAIQHIAKQLRDEATEIINRLDDKEALDKVAEDEFMYEGPG